jgi:hypothetical protein
LWFAQAIGKHQIKVRPASAETCSLLLLPLTMPLQRLSDVHGYRDAAATPACFGLSKDEAGGGVLQCCAYQQDTVIQVHIAPAQR